MESDKSLPWQVENMDFSAIDVDAMRANDDLMCLLCASSFIESGSDIYTHNLVRHYDGDEEIQQWLRDHWEPEELQHGRALAAYVQHVWPDFDWQAAFDSFFAEYTAGATPETLHPSRGMEMAARCVVETGTAVLYRAIHDTTDEPVLKELTNRIRSDEVRHYSYFYRYFNKYQALPDYHQNRLRVFRTLYGRLRDIDNEDSDIALRHVLRHHHPEYGDDPTMVKQASQRISTFVLNNLPAQMAVKMLLRPMRLPPRLNKTLESPLSWAVTRFALH